MVPRFKVLTGSDSIDLEKTINTWVERMAQADPANFRVGELTPLLVPGEVLYVVIRYQGKLDPPGFVSETSS